MKRALALAALLLGGCLPAVPPAGTKPVATEAAIAREIATPTATPAVEGGDAIPPLQVAWKYSMRVYVTKHPNGPHFIVVNQWLKDHPGP